MNQFCLHSVLLILLNSFDMSLCDLGVYSRSELCQKAKGSGPVSLQSSRWIWMEIGLLLRLIGLMNLMLILSCLINIQGREPYFVRKTPQPFNVHSDTYTSISFRLGIVIETTELCILIPVWMTLTFIWDHSYHEVKDCCVHFFCKVLCRFGCTLVCRCNLLVCGSSCKIYSSHLKFQREKEREPSWVCKIYL